MILKYVFLLLSFSCLSQINIVRVKYTVTIGEDKEILNNSSIKGYYEAAISDAENMNFTLMSDKDNYSFECTNSLSNNPISLAFCGYKGSIYSENNSNYVYENFDSAIFGKYILKKKKNIYQWILSEETKTIEGFLCYKATANDTVINPKGTFTYLLTAWYCPKIPFSVGPIGITGLPGLILELNRRNIVYGAKLIELNQEKDFIIVKPDLVNVKTEEEVIKMRTNFLNRKD